MSDQKKFSDYEAMAIEQIQNKTVGEILDTYCRPAPYISKRYKERYMFHLGDSYLIDLKTLPHDLEKILYDLIPKDEDFYNIPILGLTYVSAYECPAYAVEKNPDSSYTFICYNYETVEIFVRRLYGCVLRPSPFSTIREVDDDMEYYVLGDPDEYR